MRVTFEEFSPTHDFFDYSLRVVEASTTTAGGDLKEPDKHELY
jgi:hypothetical protein